MPQPVLFHSELEQADWSDIWRRGINDLKNLFRLVVLGGIFSLAVRPAIDPDLWWHLRTGQLTLQNHAVFRVDPFSFTRGGQPWINHEWLSDIFIFLLYRSSGMAGLILVFALLITATFFLASRRSAGGPYLAGILTLWAAIASRPAWGARPQVLTLFFASLLLTLRDAEMRNPKRMWLAVPLLLFWVNLHAGFALGIALLILFLSGDLLDLLLGSESWESARSRIRNTGLVIISCLAVAAINPYGTRMYSYPFSTLRSAAMQSKIAEWFSPDFHDLQYLPLALLMLATLAALGLSSKRLRPGELLLLLAANFAALVSVRHVGIYALIAAPILSRLVEFNFESGKRSRVPAAAAINLGIFAIFAAFVALHFRDVVRHQPDSEGNAFPVRAVSFLAAQSVPGPIFNEYDWGGYLIWRLYPNYRVFIDGRADVYGGSMMKDFGDAKSLSGDWQGVLRRWEIRTVILRTDSPLITALRMSPEWRQIYGDSQATILSRSEAR